MISSTGENLNIIISCNYTPTHNWMVFLCWYSLNKNLPDAKVVIACNRTLMNENLFFWPRKCNTHFELHKIMNVEEQINLLKEKNIINSSILIIKPEMVAIRDFEECNFDTKNLENKILEIECNSEFCCDAKEEKLCVFTSYLNGWGKFVTSDWIDKSKCPFTSENLYAKGYMTVNEARLGRLWNAVAPLFLACNGK